MDKVRPGRECRIEGCGENRIAFMQKDKNRLDGHKPICKVHQSEDTRARYKANREARLAYNRAYRKANREAKRAYNLAYREANRDATSAYRRTYYEANRETVLESMHAYHARNATRSDEEILAAQRSLRPDGLKTCRKCREDLPLAAFSVDRSKADGLHKVCRACDGTNLRRIGLPFWAEIGIDPNVCWYCDKPAKHVDHVWPQKLGGEDISENLVPACAWCNVSKNAKPPREWMSTRPLVVRDNFDAVMRYADAMAQASFNARAI
jgi:5-methylcytosine-specific restriction endonuclease McrA